MVLIPFRNTTLFRTASFLFALLLIDCIVSGQNFDDVFETSVTRSPTHRPTVSPTAVPTASPTSSPTASPTAVPTTSPTFSPTVSPTSSPSASPTFFPTLSPTAGPTRPPTKAPSEAPTTAPTIEETVSSMSLFPQMTFYTILEKDGISTEEIGQLFSDLLIDVVEEINSTYDYRYTRTALNVVVSAPDRGAGSGAYRITIDGVIYYFDEVPATETLAHSLNVYFSLWGSSNMENYLLSNGFEKASVVSIDIGEESIDFYDRQNYDGRQNIFINQEGELSKRNIVCFYILFLVVAITIVLLVYRIRLGRRRKLKREITTSQRSYTESSTSYRSEQNEDEDEENGNAAQEHSNDVVGTRSSIDMQQQSTTTTMKQSVAAKSTKTPSSSDESDTKAAMKPDEKEPSPRRKKKKKKSSKKKRKDKKPKKSKNLEEQIENDGESGESKRVGGKSDDKPETEPEVSNCV